MEEAIGLSDAESTEVPAKPLTGAPLQYVGGMLRCEQNQKDKFENIARRSHQVILRRLR